MCVLCDLYYTVILDDIFSFLLYLCVCEEVSCGSVTVSAHCCLYSVWSCKAVLKLPPVVTAFSHLFSLVTVCVDDPSQQHRYTLSHALILTTAAFFSHSVSRHEYFGKEAFFFPFFPHVTSCDFCDSSHSKV